MLKKKLAMFSHNSQQVGAIQVPMDAGVNEPEPIIWAGMDAAT